VTKNAEPGVTYRFNLHLDAPKHDRGALHTSTIQVEYPHQPCDPGKFADELAIIAAYVNIIEQRSPELLSIVIEAVDRLEALTQQPINAQLFEHLAAIRQTLLPLSPFLQERQVYLLGNAHIDVAWLWPIAETKDVTKRTFAAVLKLQQTYPELIFNQTTALSYQWIENEAPQLFTQIQAAVAKGKWELIGGMWVESDCNLPSGESLIRQILYGKQHFQAKFNQDVKIAWLPDSFGFNWQLPQILSKSGFEAFTHPKTGLE
jgi:alpha-mannosidase